MTPWARLLTIFCLYFLKNSGIWRAFAPSPLTRRYAPRDRESLPASMPATRAGRRILRRLRPRAAAAGGRAADRSAGCAPACARLFDLTAEVWSSGYRPRGPGPDGHVDEALAIIECRMVLEGCAPRRRPGSSPVRGQRLRELGDELERSVADAEPLKYWRSTPNCTAWSASSPARRSPPC